MYLRRKVTMINDMSHIADASSEPWVYEVIGKVIKQALETYCRLHGSQAARRAWLDKHKKDHYSCGSKKKKLLDLNYEYDSVYTFLFSANGGLRVYVEDYGLPLDIDYIRKKAEEGAKIGWEKIVDDVLTTNGGML